MSTSSARAAAVARAELRGLGRQKTPFVLRTVYAALLAAAVYFAGITIIGLLSRIGWSGEALALLGTQVFSAVVIVQAFLAVLLGALLGVASVHAERHNHTLGLLVLSQFEVREIVLGKFTAILALVVSILLAGLPIYVLLGWAGGVGFGWIVWTAVYTPALAGLGTATGLFCGLRQRGVAGATSAAILLLAIPVLLAFSLGNIGFRFDGFGLDSWLVAVIVPLWLIGSMTLGVGAVAQQSSGQSELVGIGFVVMIVCTLFLLFLAVRWLPRAATAGPDRGLRGYFEDLDRFFESINVGNIRFEFGAANRPRGNPVTWMTRILTGMGHARYNIRIFTLAALGGLISVVFAVGGEIGRYLLVAMWLVLGVGLALAMGAGAFGEEKTRHTFGVLMATPLSAERILSGKIFVFVRLLLLLAVPTVSAILFIQYLEPILALELGQFSFLVLCEMLFIYILTLSFSLALGSSLKAGVAGFTVAAALHVHWLAARIAGDDLNEILYWILGALFFSSAVVTAVALKKKWPVIGLIAVLATLTPILGSLHTVFDLTFPHAIYALVLTAALIYIHALFYFDRMAGRST